MPHAETIISTNNYTLTKILRTGISPIAAMIGISAYYGQVISNPILGTINSLLFGKKLGIDIWSLNQPPNSKRKMLNASKKLVLGLGTITLANVGKFTGIHPNTPTESPITTTVNPFPDNLFLSNSDDNQALMDWDTYMSLNSYGIANLLAGLTELIPNRFENMRKIANMATGGCLIGSGVAMGINNGFDNASAVPTIIAGASEIIHSLLPMQTSNTNELQETSFNHPDDKVPIARSIEDYGSINSDFDNRPIYQDNVEPINDFSSIDLEYDEPQDWLTRPQLQLNNSNYQL